MRFLSSLLLCVYVLFCADAHNIDAAVLTEDTVWNGRIVLQEDLIVPPGITLTLKAGTVVEVQPSDSTKVGPEYLDPTTEITVRGHLEAEGEEGSPVVFTLSSEAEPGQNWAGIIIDNGNAWLRQTEIRHAETGLHVLKGWVKLKHSRLTENRYGLIVQGEHSGAKIEESIISGNEYGAFALDGASLINEQSSIDGNQEKDFFERLVKVPECEQAVQNEPDLPSITRTYEEESVIGTTTWQGRILINGVVRLPVDNRLIIMPGTIVEFTKRDTNLDGLGENGLLLQGVVIAKGTPLQPIIFRSAEAVRRPGDWDAINIMGSDGTQNLLEYCRVEDAYRALHFHFTNVAINHCVLRNNYRGIQFQESVVVVQNTLLRDNKSAIQARDSELLFYDNQLFYNYSGANFFRLNLNASGNRFYANAGDGVRIREGRVVLDGNVMDANRFGIRISDVVYGSFNKNIINNNAETGLSLRNSDNIEVTGNVVQANGINGISVQDSGGLIANNLISGNGERGMGIESFAGAVRYNNFSNNGRFALDIDGSRTVDASENWWGGGAAAAVVYDRQDNAEVGKALVDPVKEKPVPFVWPQEVIRTDVAWLGDIRIPVQTRVIRDAVLTVEPGTRVGFTKDSGLQIDGSMLARGTVAERISFALDRDYLQDGDTVIRWGEIWFERARDSVLHFCDFSGAVWGVHSHFSPLDVFGCHFMDNDGGIRFRSGPVQVRQSLFERNRIGMRSFIGQAVVDENTFINNEIGIFVRSGGSGLQIHRNNIYDNSRYSIRLGDFNKEDVDARENWWGGKDPQESIFDAGQEPGIGRILYEPVLMEPIAKVPLQQ